MAEGDGSDDIWSDEVVNDCVCGWGACICELMHSFCVHISVCLCVCVCVCVCVCIYALTSCQFCLHDNRVL